VALRGRRQRVGLAPFSGSRLPVSWRRSSGWHLPVSWRLLVSWRRSSGWRLSVSWRQPASLASANRARDRTRTSGVRSAEARTACQPRDASRRTDQGMASKPMFHVKRPGHPARPRLPGPRVSPGSGSRSGPRSGGVVVAGRPGAVSSRSGVVPVGWRLGSGWCPGPLGQQASSGRTVSHGQRALEARSGRGRPQDDVANQRSCFCVQIACLGVVRGRNPSRRVGPTAVTGVCR
jgi:hypothetical protein